MKEEDERLAEERRDRAIKLVKKAGPDAAERIRKSECFVLRAPQLYRSTDTQAAPRPGQMARLGSGQLHGAREAVHAALRRGEMRLVDAREEINVINAALEMLGRYGPGTVPVLISDEPFKIRLKRKPGSKARRKRKKGRR